MKRFVFVVLFSILVLSAVGESTSVDINGDEIVNLMDIARVGMYWGKPECGSCGGADITGDGNVDLDDLGELAAQWLVHIEPPAGPIGAWMFDDGTANDSSGNWHDGSLIGDAQIIEDVERADVLSLDGGGDYLKINDNISSFSEKTLTVSVWIKPNSLDETRVMLDKSGIFSYKLVDGKQQFDATGKAAYFSSSMVTVGTWQHLAVVFAGNSNVKFYRNGSLISQTGSATSLNTSTDSTRIGCDSGGNYCFDGMMDDVRVYDYALTDGQISDLAKKDYYTICGRISDIESLYDMNNITMSGLPGNPVTDESGDYIAVLDYEWSGTVTPIKTGFTFEPASRVYSNVTSDQNDPYEASIIRYAISGNIGSVEDIELSDFPYIPATDANGNYTTLVDYGWSGTVTPEKDGYAFIPEFRTYSNVTSAQSNQNYTPRRIINDINILAGWWSFDKGNANDSSGYENHGTIHDSPVWLEAGGKLRAAYSFDGVDDYITIPDFDITNELYEFSVSLWFKISDISGSGYQYIFSYGEESQPNNLDIYIRNAESSSPGTVTTRLRLSEGSKWQQSSPVVVADGKWHLYTIKVSSIDGATVYIDTDQVQNNSVIKGSAFDPDTDIYIAAKEDLDAARYFGSLDVNDGLVDDVRVFGRALSDSEIYDLYNAVYEASNPYPADDAEDVARNTELIWTSGSLANIHDVYFGTNLAEVAARAGSVYLGPQSQNTFSPSMLEGSTTYYWCVDEVNDLYEHSPWPGKVWSFATVDANMIGWWKFNGDDADGIATDSTGYGRDGILVGGAAIVNDYKRGKVLSCEAAGTNNYVDCGGGATDGDWASLTNQMTAMAWVKMDGFTVDYQYILSKGSTFRVSRHSDTTNLRFFNTGFVPSSLQGSTNVADGQWHHVVTTYNGVERFLYIDGMVDANDLETGDMGYGVQNFLIGCHEDWPERSWKGLMDDVRLYDRALSQSEIYHIYTDSDTQKALNPMPEDKDWNISLTPTLSWIPGDKTASYGQYLYFGTDYEAVANRDASVYIGDLDTSSFNPSLKLYRQYYWAIDIVDTDNATWYGDVWSFKTRHVLTQTEGYYKDIFFDGGKSIAAYESLPATRLLGLSAEFVKDPTIDGYNGAYYLMTDIHLGDWDDDNGVLLYPDGDARFRAMYCGGGTSLTHCDSLLAQEAGMVDAQDRIRQFYANGGGYCGSCAGAAMAFEHLGSRGATYFQLFDKFKGDFTNIGGSSTDYEIPDGITERRGHILPKSPLLKYYDFGGDYYINSVRQNGGNWCKWWDPAKKWPVSGADVCAVYNDKIDGVVVREGYKTTDGASIWAYKRNEQSGRITPCGGHPEGVTSGEKRDLQAAMFAYAMDGGGCAVVKAALSDGITRQMDDNNTAGYEKIGDKQYHHFTIDVQANASKLEIVLDGSMYDMNLYAKLGDFAFDGEDDIVPATNGTGCDETITIQSPAAGTWYIGVKCVTVPTRSKLSGYYQYTGNFEVLNGLAYDITATVTE